MKEDAERMGKVSVIVTRNASDFTKETIPTVLPEVFRPWLYCPWLDTAYLSGLRERRSEVVVLFVARPARRRGSFCGFRGGVPWERS